MAGLYGPMFNGGPLQKAYGEAMLAATDLGKQGAAGGQENAQKLAVKILLHVVLVHAIDGRLVRWLSTFANQPQQFNDSVAQRLNDGEPVKQILLMSCIRLA